jgi:hypothetical protein
MQVHPSYKTRPTAAFVRLDEDAGTSYFAIGPKWGLAEFRPRDESESSPPPVSEEPSLAADPPRPPFQRLPLSLVRQIVDIPPRSWARIPPRRPETTPMGLRNSAGEPVLMWLYDRATNRFVGPGEPPVEL